MPDPKDRKSNLINKASFFEAIRVHNQSKMLITLSDEAAIVHRQVRYMYAKLRDQLRKDSIRYASPVILSALGGSVQSDNHLALALDASLLSPFNFYFDLPPQATQTARSILSYYRDEIEDLITTYIRDLSYLLETPNLHLSKGFEDVLVAQIKGDISYWKQFLTIIRNQASSK